MPLRHLPPQRAHVHTQALTHRHTRLGMDAFQRRIYQKPRFRHQIATNLALNYARSHGPDESHASSVSQQGEPESICQRWCLVLSVYTQIIDREEIMG